MSLKPLQTGMQSLSLTDQHSILFPVDDQQGGPANQNEVETRRQQLLHYFH